VSSHDQRADLDPQVARLTEWATVNGEVCEVVCTVGFGQNNKRPGRGGFCRTHLRR